MHIPSRFSASYMTRKSTVSWLLNSNWVLAVTPINSKLHNSKHIKASHEFLEQLSFEEKGAGDHVPLQVPKMNQNPNNDRVPHYQSMLKESIDHFLAEYRNGVTDFRDFSSIFSRLLLQNSPDPPLQILWFYSALEFHTTKLGVRGEPSRRASAAKDLFQLLVSCSDCCCSMKKIVILAPVVYELYRLALHEKDLKSEVEGLLEGVVGYCSIFCSKELRDDDGDGPTRLEPGFLDVIPVWMVDRSGVGDCLKEFFPVVSDQFRKGLRTGCEVGFLAGVVMCEALLLKMCLKFEPGITKAEQEKRLHGSAVQTITGFRNAYFLDTLFRIMLEPVLPVVFLLGSQNEVLLKEVLYNAVMMIEYSFINPQAGVSLYANGLQDFAVSWLFVADLAIQSAREKGDQGKAVSYVNAFSRSCIPIQLINWVTSQSGVGRKISRPNVSTPIALIKWLLIVEDQGLAVFGGETTKHSAKANFFTSRTECKLPVIKHFFNNLDKNLFVNSMHGGTEEVKHDGDTDIEMVDTMDTVTLAADDRMNTTGTDGTRKRKEGTEDETKTQLKFMRCQFHENSVRENSFIFRQQ